MERLKIINNENEISLSKISPGFINYISDLEPSTKDKLGLLLREVSKEYEDLDATAKSAIRVKIDIALAHLAKNDSESCFRCLERLKLVRKVVKIGFTIDHALLVTKSFDPNNEATTIFLKALSEIQKEHRSSDRLAEVLLIMKDTGPEYAIKIAQVLNRLDRERASLDTNVSKLVKKITVAIARRERLESTSSQNENSLNVSDDANDLNDLLALKKRLAEINAREEVAMNFVSQGKDVPKTLFSSSVLTSLELSELSESDTESRAITELKGIEEKIAADAALISPVFKEYTKSPFTEKALASLKQSSDALTNVGDLRGLSFSAKAPDVFKSNLFKHHAFNRMIKLYADHVEALKETRNAFSLQRDWFFKNVNVPPKAVTEAGLEGFWPNFAKEQINNLNAKLSGPDTPLSKGNIQKAETALARIEGMKREYDKSGVIQGAVFAAMVAGAVAGGLAGAKFVNLLGQAVNMGKFKVFAASSIASGVGSTTGLYTAGGAIYGLSGENLSGLDFSTSGFLQTAAEMTLLNGAVMLAGQGLARSLSTARAMEGSSRVANAMRWIGRGALGSADDLATGLELGALNRLRSLTSLASSPHSQSGRLRIFLSEMYQELVESGVGLVAQPLEMLTAVLNSSKSGALNFEGIHSNLNALLAAYSVNLDAKTFSGDSVQLNKLAKELGVTTELRDNVVYLRSGSHELRLKYEQPLEVRDGSAVVENPTQFSELLSTLRSHGYVMQKNTNNNSVLTYITASGKILKVRIAENMQRSLAAIKTLFTQAKEAVVSFRNNPNGNNAMKLKIVFSSLLIPGLALAGGQPSVSVLTTIVNVIREYGFYGAAITFGFAEISAFVSTIRQNQPVLDQFPELAFRLRQMWPNFLGGVSLNTTKFKRDLKRVRDINTTDPNIESEKNALVTKITDAMKKKTTKCKSMANSLNFGPLNSREVKAVLDNLMTALNYFQHDSSLENLRKIGDAVDSLKKVRETPISFALRTSLYTTSVGLLYWLLYPDETPPPSTKTNTPPARPVGGSSSSADDRGDDLFEDEEMDGHGDDGDNSYDEALKLVE